MAEEKVSQEKIKELFEQFFAAADKNPGFLEKEEASDMLKMINSMRFDGKE